MKKIILSFLLLLSAFALADNSYYPTALQDQINKGSLHDDALKVSLNSLLSAGQVNLGYDGARRIMFGKIYLKQDNNGYYVQDVYCQKKFYASDKVGPNAIPNQDRLNCEHTWPQSKFSHAYPAEIQKADLHHLYPSDSKANGIRGNFDFSDIGSDNGKLAEDDCTISKSGASVTSGGDDYFEPPTNHKGNVARSLFYFSIRYKISIPKAEEEVLRRWNDLDPVDQEEMNKNDAIFAVQKNRNPFIDYPNLVHLINKF